MDGGVHIVLTMHYTKQGINVILQHSEYQWHRVVKVCLLCMVWPTLCWCNMEAVIKGSCFLSVGWWLLSETEPAQGQIVTKPVSQSHCFVSQYIQATSPYNQPCCQWVRRRTCQNIARQRHSHRRPDIPSTIASYCQSVSHQSALIAHQLATMILCSAKESANQDIEQQAKL